ncbi:hypothetical protein OAF34_05090 [Pirellulaceae bacterium]|nr:hypothetical protein [Pirellulaceae bacterium]
MEAQHNAESKFFVAKGSGGGFAEKRAWAMFLFAGIGTLKDSGQRDGGLVLVFDLEWQFISKGFVSSKDLVGRKR